MITAMLFTISVAALGQFALFYWRSVVAGVAAQPLSDMVRTAAGLASASVSSADFDAVLNVHDLTPGLNDPHGGVQTVRAYYTAIRALGRLAERFRLSLLAGWTDQEMATCARYVAVLVDQRLERNLACAAEVRSC